MLKPRHKLKCRILEKFGDMESFAKAMGIAKNTLSMKLNYHVAISDRDIIKMNDLLDISIDEIGVFYFT